jgi:hypothetical protein
MAAYVPVIIWVVSAIICHYIAQSRNLRPNFIQRLIAVILGPFAIPLTFLVKPQESREINKTQL